MLHRLSWGISHGLMVIYGVGFFIVHGHMNRGGVLGSLPPNHWVAHLWTMPNNYWTSRGIRLRLAWFGNVKNFSVFVVRHQLFLSLSLCQRWHLSTILEKSW